MVQYLVAERVTADDDGVLPARDRARNTLQDDGLTEDGTTEDISDGTVGTLPHLLQLELLHTSLIWRDSCALDAYTMLEDCLRRLDCDFVASLGRHEVES